MIQHIRTNLGKFKLGEILNLQILVKPLNNKQIKHVNHYYILFIPVYNIRRQQIDFFEQF